MEEAATPERLARLLIDEQGSRQVSLCVHEADDPWLEQKILHNTDAILVRSRSERIEPRQVAVALARERVLAVLAFHLGN
jgi:hypothetical protein